MISRTGDLFTTDCPAIGHGVNTQGIMGAGVADLIRRHYPYTHIRYQQMCKEGRLRPGQVYVALDQKFIFNMATQDLPGPHARLSWVEDAAAAAANTAETLGIERIAIPRIGCGIGGLEWDEVKPILLDVEGRWFNWEVWTL